MLKLHSHENVSMKINMVEPEAGKCYNRERLKESDEFNHLQHTCWNQPPQVNQLS